MEYELIHRLAQEGAGNPQVLAVLMRVNRTRFVPEPYRALAHEDEALPIGLGQTISQPYVVAAMTQALGVRAGERVLEVGTGSGYQAAVLAELGCEVFSIERIEDLAERAALALAAEGYRVHLRVGDGSLGWPAEAPFAGIVVTAATPEIPPALVEQLAEGRRLVIPIGEPEFQRLCVVTRHGIGSTVSELMPVRFVPLVHS